MKYKQNSFLVAILDAIFNFSMKYPDPDLTPKPESLPIVSSSTLNYQTFSVEGVERKFFFCSTGFCTIIFTFFFGSNSSSQSLGHHFENKMKF